MISLPLVYSLAKKNNFLVNDVFFRMVLGCGRATALLSVCGVFEEYHHWT